MTAEELWAEFEEKSNVDSVSYEAWMFGDEPDILAELVKKGIKTATASLHYFYEIENEEIPKVGDYSIVLDSKEEAVCIIKNTKVYIVKYSEVSEKHAYKEGEGDRTLGYWRRVHKDFFANELKSIGISFDEDMKVLDSLPAKLRAKAFCDIELLQEMGEVLREPYVKHIKGNKNKGLYELRIKFADDIARIFYFTYIDNKYLLMK